MTSFLFVCSFYSRQNQPRRPPNPGGLQKTSPVPEDDSAARCAVWAPEGHVGTDPFLLLAPRLGSPLSGSKTSSAGLADGNFTSIGSAGSDEPTAGRRPSSAEGIRRRVGFICSPLQGPPALPLTVLVPWGEGAH